MRRDIDKLLGMIASGASQEAILFAMAYQAGLAASDPAVAAMVTVLDNPTAFSLQFSHSTHVTPGPFLSSRSLLVSDDKLIAVSEPNVFGEPRHVVAYGCRSRHIAYPSNTVLHHILYLAYPFSECLKSLVTVRYVDSAWSCYAMALRGLGVAWLPESLVQEDLASGRLLRADIPELDIPLGIRLYRSTPDGDSAIDDAWNFFLAQSLRRPHFADQVLTTY